MSTIESRLIEAEAAIEKLRVENKDLKEAQYGFVPNKDIPMLGEIPSCEIVEGGIKVLWRTLVLHIQKHSNENALLAKRYLWLRDLAYLDSPD